MEEEKEEEEEMRGQNENVGGECKGREGGREYEKRKEEGRGGD